MSLQADMLVLVTSVPRVEIGFGTPASRVALRLTVSDAQHHLDEGEFPPGSMGPKIEGAARFVSGGGSAVITDSAHLATAVRGHHGTWIVPDRDGPSVFGSAPVAA
jgi:carbamate kinase